MRTTMQCRMTAHLLSCPQQTHLFNPKPQAPARRTMGSSPRRQHVAASSHQAIRSWRLFPDGSTSTQSSTISGSRTTAGNRTAIRHLEIGSCGPSHVIRFTGITTESSFAIDWKKFKINASWFMIRVSDWAIGMTHCRLQCVRQNSHIRNSTYASPIQSAHSNSACCSTILTASSCRSAG